MHDLRHYIRLVEDAEKIIGQRIFHVTGASDVKLIWQGTRDHFYHGPNFVRGALVATEFVGNYIIINAKKFKPSQFAAIASALSDRSPDTKVRVSDGNDEVWIKLSSLASYPAVVQQRADAREAARKAAEENARRRNQEIEAAQAAASTATRSGNLSLQAIQHMSFGDFCASGLDKRFIAFVNEDGANEIDELLARPYNFYVDDHKGNKQAIIDDFVERQFRVAQNRLRGLNPHGDVIEITRYLKISNPKAWVARIEKAGGGQIGIYWTFDEDGWKSEGEKYFDQPGVGGPSAVWGDRNGPKTGSTVSINARVHPTSVDWAATMFSNMSFYSGHEHEITLIKGAPVTLISLGTSRSHLLGHAALAGKKFTA